jgi:hypothetical protein
MIPSAKDFEIHFVHVGRVHSSDRKLSLHKFRYLVDHDSRDCAKRNMGVLDMC